MYYHLCLLYLGSSDRDNQCRAERRGRGLDIAPPALREASRDVERGRACFFDTVIRTLPK